MTSSCSDMRIYEKGFMFLGDFIPFNMVKNIERYNLEEDKSLLIIKFIYKLSEPDSIVMCHVKGIFEEITNLARIIINLKYSFTGNDMIPVYETDRVENYDFRGELKYPIQVYRVFI